MPQFLYMSLVAGAIGVLSWNMGNKIITPVNGVLFMNVVPVAAFAVSALSGIVPTPVQLAGAAITVAALVMNNLYQRRRVQRESASPYGSGTDKGNTLPHRVLVGGRVRHSKFDCSTSALGQDQTSRRIRPTSLFTPQSRHSAARF